MASYLCGNYFCPVCDFLTSLTVSLFVQKF